MLIHQKIEQMIHDYDDARRTVGIFLIKEQHRIQNYSMQNIADETFTSKTTLVRVAKILGYSGWNEFIKKYKEEIIYLESHVNDVDVNIPFQEEDTFMQVAGKLNALKKNAIQETLELLDESEIKKAVDLLYNAKRICIFGVSVNYYLALLFQHKMLQIGKNVEIVNQSEMKFQSYSLTKGDCAIIISYSGNDESRMPTALLDILHKNEVSIIAITSLGQNLLKELSTVALSITSREKLYSKINSFSTEASISFLLDILYACYFNLNFKKNLEYKIKMSQEVEIKRSSTSEGIKEI